MRFRTIGNMRVSAVGLGTMPMSGARARPDGGGGDARAEAIRAIHAALDARVTLIDTADAYVTSGEGQGSNELLLAEALASYSGDRSHILVATKGGMINRSDGPWERNGRPEHLKQAAHASLRRLGGDALGLYQLHRHDPNVPYAESVGALRDLLDQGVIRMAGVSNATVEQIQIAMSVLGGRLASVQNEFSPTFRKSANELDFCTRHGIAFLTWSPLGGIGRAGALGARNNAFADVAATLGVSAQQVALAWELALGPTVITIPGASRAATARDSAAAADLDLTAEHMARLNASPSLDVSAY